MSCPHTFMDGKENCVSSKIIIQYKNRCLVPRAGEPANFLGAPDFFLQAAPALDFFPKRLRLLVFFFERLRLQGAKNTRLRSAPAPDYWLSLATYSFPRKLVR